MRKKALIFDLDGTLCDITHRRHYVEGKRRNFDKFNASCVLDKPHEWCREMINLMYKNDYEVLLVSGREGIYRPETEQWLKDNNIHYHQLFMRAPKDYRPDTVIKKEIFEKQIRDKYDVHFVVDDRQQVVNMWRSEGLVCLQCAEGNF